MMGNKLYVGNLSYSVNSQQLEELFGKFGEVVQVNIIEGKGFGFVEMADQEAADKAKTELNGTDFEGRALKIDEARPPKKKNNFRSGGGGGGGGGGRGGFRGGRY
ncbi:MAG: RNA-binding protein [Deltaproteobacteria bacterium]|nr:RNA-binding protein [Deltaproteobacteria bacterium]